MLKFVGMSQSGFPTLEGLAEIQPDRWWSGDPHSKATRMGLPIRYMNVSNLSPEESGLAWTQGYFEHHLRTGRSGGGANEESSTADV